MKKDHILSIKKSSAILILSLIPSFGFAQNADDLSIESEEQILFDEFDSFPEQIDFFDSFEQNQSISQDSVIVQDGLVPFRCPIEKVRDAYQNLLNPEDNLIALAIEQQVLGICKQSQEALIQIARNEATLKGLFEPIMVKNETPQITSFIEPVFEEVVESAPLLPEPEPEIIEIIEEEDIEPEGPGILEKLAAILPQAIDNAEFVKPDHQLSAVMKDRKGWKAMIVENGNIQVIRPGDRLDDGSRILEINRDGVRMSSASGFNYILESDPS